MTTDHHSQTTPGLNDGRLNRIIEEAILEDVGLGDVTTASTVDADLPGSGEIRVKESGVIAGLEVTEAVFSTVDHEITMTPGVADGTSVAAGMVAAVVTGPFGSLLRAERMVLNILQRMSGIATMTRAFVDAVAGTHAAITDTRKTAPGLRMLDKYAVVLGGGVNHRFGLDDMVLIKDNHIAAAGGITRALERCRKYLTGRNIRIPVEIETASIADVEEALRCGIANRIMLDNFRIEDMKKAVDIIAGRVEVEASGNITLATVRAVAETGVDFISVGALTHSPRALDISFKIGIRRP